MFKIKCSDLPTYITGTENNSLAELAMPGAAPGIAYEGIGAENFLGPCAEEYQSYLATSESDNYPWLVPIPHYSAKMNNKDYKLIYRSCCDYINPTTNGSLFTTDSETKEWFNDGNNNWYDYEGGQSLFNEPTSHIMIALQGAGGGGSGSSGNDSGSGGGAGAATILMINIGKLSSFRFEIGYGGAGGQKGTNANVNRHGADGGWTNIILKQDSSSQIVISAPGGTGGHQFAFNNGDYNEVGVGGSKISVYNRYNEIACTLTTSDLQNVNYVGIKFDGTKAPYPDTNREAIAYILKIFPGGDGGLGGVGKDNRRKPISTSLASFYPGITYTPPEQAERPHRVSTIYPEGQVYGGDGGYSAYGQGGVGSYSYNQSSNPSFPHYIWTDAQDATGYGSGGAGDVFFVLGGKNGTAGQNGCAQILSANSSTGALPDIVRQSGILSPGAITGSYVAINDAKPTRPTESTLIDDFVACSYEKNNEGVVTPTIYTQGSGMNPHPIDWGGPYFYTGTKTISSKVYDGWRKIDGIMTWDGADKKVVYTNRVVTNNRFNKDLCNREGVHTVSSTNSQTIEPTCILEGYTYSNCSECGYRFKGNIVPALGHSEGDWIVTKEPTVNSFGNRKKNCTRCNTILATEAIPMLDPELDTQEPLAEDVVVWVYYVTNDDIHEGVYNDRDFVAGGYAKDNTGTAVPVLYVANSEGSTEPDPSVRFYYIGQEELDGITYDKWRRVGKVEGEFNWEETGSTCFAYTNVVVQFNRFKDTIFANDLSGTVEVSWVSVEQILINLPSTYKFNSTPITIDAPLGRTFKEIVSLTKGATTTTSGKAPSGMTPVATLAEDGKSLTIQLTTDIVPITAGKGTTQVTYVCSCFVENEKIETGVAGVPYTTTASAQNGNQYPITSQSPPTITAPEGYIIKTVEFGSISSANASHGVGNIKANASIASDKKSVVISLSGYVQGVGTGSNSSYISVPYTITYILEQ